MPLLHDQITQIIPRKLRSQQRPGVFPLSPILAEDARSQKRLYINRPFFRGVVLVEVRREDGLDVVFVGGADDGTGEDPRAVGERVGYAVFVLDGVQELVGAEAMHSAVDVVDAEREAVGEARGRGAF